MIKLDLRVCVAGAIQAAPLDNHKPFALEYESLLSQGDIFRRVLPLTDQLKISLCTTFRHRHRRRCRLIETAKMKVTKREDKPRDQEEAERI